MDIRHNIVIVGGAGSIGSLFTALLCRGADVTVIVRKSSQARRLRKNGIKVKSAYIETASPKYNVSLKAPDINIISSEEVMRGGKKFPPADLIIILVKSYDTADACRSAMPFIGKDTIILTLQNGLGNFETIKKFVSRIRVAKGNSGKNRGLFHKENSRSCVLAGITTHGAMKISDGRVIHTGRGGTFIAYDNKMEKVFARRAAEILLSSGFKDVEVVKGRERLLWSKLIINAAINPVGAIFNITNGGILNNDFAFNLAVAAAQEAETIGRIFLKKNHLDARPIYKKSDIVGKIRSVLRATAPNKNSMLQDIIAGRPTELESITGAILRLSCKKSAAGAPINRLLYNSVGILSKNSRLSSDFV